MGTGHPSPIGNYGELKQINPNAVINIGVPIVVGNNGSWVLYAAGGTTNLYNCQNNPTASAISELHVGAAGFTQNSIIPNGANCDPAATRIVAIANARATFNFGKAGQGSVCQANITTLNVNAGSTVNATNAAVLTVGALNVNAGSAANPTNVNVTTGASLTATTLAVKANAALNVNNGAVTVTNALTAANMPGSVVVSNGGSLTTANGGAMTNLTLTSGTLTNDTNALTITNFTHSGASAVKGTGAVDLAALTIVNGESFTYDNVGTITSATVNDGGTLTVKKGVLAGATVKGTLSHQYDNATAVNLLTLDGGTVNVSTGKTLTATTISGAGTLAGPGNVAVTNLTATGGALTKSAGGAVANAVADGATLNLYGGTAISAAVQNGGTLNYKLAGNALTLTALDGTLNNARGAELTVNGLTDIADATVSGPVQFADAIAVTGTLTADAPLKFANGLTVNGGTLDVKFDANRGAPVITVVGVADFSGGGKMKVAASGGKGGSSYAIMAANAINGLDLANVTLTGGTAIMEYALRLDPDRLLLLCEALRHAYSEFAENPADRAMAQVLDQIAAQPGLAARMDDVFSALDAMGTAAEVSRALSELNACSAVAAAHTNARMAWRGFDNLLSGRLSREAVLLAAANMMRSSFAVHPTTETRAQSGGIPGDAADVAAGLEAMWRPGREWRGFLQMDGGFGAEGNSPVGAVGYDYRGLGLLAGLERRFGDELALGGLIGWTTNHSDLYQSRGEAHDNVLRLGGYGAYRWDRFFASFSPTVGCHLIETRRHIGFLGRTARGERTGMDAHLLGQAGYVFELPHDILLTPEASLGLTYMHDPAYRETNGGGATLRVGATDDWSLTQDLKLTAGKMVRLKEDLALLPEIWGGWEHEYGTPNDVSCAFAAAPGLQWRVPVADIAADRAVVGAGVHAYLNDHLDLYGRYELKLWDGGCFNQFTLGAGIKF